MYLTLLAADNLNLRFADEPSPEFNIDPSTCIEADLPKKSVLTVVALFGDLYNYQPGT